MPQRKRTDPARLDFIQRYEITVLPPDEDHDWVAEYMGVTGHGSTVRIALDVLWRKLEKADAE